jgi:hypothetical protein
MMKKIFFMTVLVLLTVRVYSQKTLSDYLANGFRVELEDIYLMPGKETVPIADEPVASLFDTKDIVTLPNYQTTDYSDFLIMRDLKKGDRWFFTELLRKPDKVHYIEEGYGSTYRAVKHTTEIRYRQIVSDSGKLYFTVYPSSNVYSYRGEDNIDMSIMTRNRNGEESYTNLVLTFLTYNGDALFDEGHIYLDTNAQVQIESNVSEPLTGARVAQIVKRGKRGKDYEYYLKDGRTLIKIGHNLYTPTFGKTYRYWGTTNQQGMMRSYVRFYYRLKFKIVG